MMSAVMMKVLEQQVASLTRQVADLAAKNADLATENERVRNLLTEFDKRHDLDAAEIERLSMLLEAVKAWAEGKPNNPPKTGLTPRALAKKGGA